MQNLNAFFAFSLHRLLNNSWVLVIWGVMLLIRIHSNDCTSQSAIGYTAPSTMMKNESQWLPLEYDHSLCSYLHMLWPRNWLPIWSRPDWTTQVPKTTCSKDELYQRQLVGWRRCLQSFFVWLNMYRWSDRGTSANVLLTRQGNQCWGRSKPMQLASWQLARQTTCTQGKWYRRRVVPETIHTRNNLFHVRLVPREVRYPYQTGVNRTSSTVLGRLGNGGMNGDTFVYMNDHK